MKNLFGKWFYVHVILLDQKYIRFSFRIYGLLGISRQCFVMQYPKICIQISGRVGTDSLVGSMLTYRNYTSFSLDPTLKWSEMTKQLRRDDANPLDNIQINQISP